MKSLFLGGWLGVAGYASGLLALLYCVYYLGRRAGIRKTVRDLTPLVAIGMAAVAVYAIDEMEEAAAEDDDPRVTWEELTGGER